MDDTETTTIEVPKGAVVVVAEFKVSGHKSSEGDGRTADDIRRELREQREQEDPRTWD